MIGAMGMGLMPWVEAQSSLARADSWYAAGKMGEAAEAYRSFLATSPKAAAEVQALGRLGQALKALQRYGEAATNFLQVVAKASSSSAAAQVGFGVAQLARWEAAGCFMAAREYRRALPLFEEIEANRTPVICGNAAAEEIFRLRTHRGACHDALGEAKEALRNYFQAAFRSALLLRPEPAVHLRILEMYESAGELPVLIGLLDELDRRELAALNASAKALAKSCNLPEPEEISQERFRAMRSSGIIRRVIELRFLAAQGKRDGLIEVLKSAPSNGAPDPIRDWEGIEAARLLALSAKAAVPELIAAAERMPRLADTFLPYALGRCATAEALAWLKVRVLRAREMEEVVALLHGLDTAGLAGVNHLNELRAAAPRLPLVRQAFGAYLIYYPKAGLDRGRLAPEFSAWKVTGPLPVSLKELE